MFSEDKYSYKITKDPTHFVLKSCCEKTPTDYNVLPEGMVVMKMAPKKKNAAKKKMVIDSNVFCTKKGAVKQCGKMPIDFKFNISNISISFEMYM